MIVKLRKGVNNHLLWTIWWKMIIELTLGILPPDNSSFGYEERNMFWHWIFFLILKDV